MAFQQFNDRPGKNFGPRPPMVQGNWTCSECGVEITQLPFEPAPDRPIYCRDCWAKKRESRPGR